MKWVFLTMALAGILPISQWLRRNQRAMEIVWIAMGFLPFVIARLHLYMAIVSWPMWPGFVKGIEISILDILALAVYFSLPNKRRPLPFRFSMIFYFFAALLSVAQTEVPVAAIFYCWQLARMFLLYSVVVRGCDNERFFPSLMTGMAAGIYVETCFVIWERFGQGIIQTSGTFSHQNLLGLITHFVVFPSFALLLAGKSGWRLGLVPVGGAIVAILTVSRGTIGVAAFGYLVLFLGSVLRGWSFRKALVAAVGAFALVLLTPLALASFEQRFKIQTSSSEYDERAAFQKAATNILSDYPMGTGANNYVIIANTRGYNENAGVAPTTGSNSANVHNVYLLVAAETGYLGLLSFILMLFRPLTVAFVSSWRNRGDPKGDVLLGLAVGLLAVYLQSLFEWILVTYDAQYMLALAMGLVGGLSQQLGYWGRLGGTQSDKRGPFVSPKIRRLKKDEQAGPSSTGAGPALSG